MRCIKCDSTLSSLSKDRCKYGRNTLYTNTDVILCYKYYFELFFLTQMNVKFHCFELLSFEQKATKFNPCLLKRDLGKSTSGKKKHAPTYDKKDDDVMTSTISTTLPFP